VIEADVHEFHNWIFRFRPASATPSRLLVLLHGITGDENSMWIFARKLPAQVAVIAPRGLYNTPEGGYTWREIRPGTWSLPAMNDLLPSAESLINFIDDWSQSGGVIVNQIDIIGFSQGAALSYAIALFYPERIRALAALSGFLPDGAEDMIERHILAGKSIFIAHGRQDNTVPVEKARRAVAILEGSGAQVKYCESDDGHKVSLDCFSEMAGIFQ
jgi:phospholipase/carboxylesterase